ncbi:hypothetical protein HPB52_004075 [Rhipicephalus sanguineus]|uniref:Uncharacterized protein n=1 Tax=Rhipicephalus sanguineus TaxID=34632 RepID=A0A9D4PU92_RHISA|nr:hypothetical protein HPB52_004075 [Rhipicephalus sanguineus]
MILPYVPPDEAMALHIVIVVVMAGIVLEEQRRRVWRPFANPTDTYALARTCREALPLAGGLMGVFVLLREASKRVIPFFGCFCPVATFLIAQLPYYDSRCCPHIHGGMVLVAAGLATMGTYSIDSLADKIYGPNLPCTLGVPTVSACMSLYGWRNLWSAFLSVSCGAKVYITSMFLKNMPGEPVQGPQAVPATAPPRWLLLVGSWLGIFADAAIAALPHYDAETWATPRSCREALPLVGVIMVIFVVLREASKLAIPLFSWFCPAATFLHSCHAYGLRMSVILRTRGVVDNRTAAELYAQRLHHRVRAIGDPGSAGPGPPTGPVPDIPTPRWRLLTGAGLGVGADAVIAILPHYDARNYPWEHTARVVVAVAFAACGIDGIDGLVAKIFGPNQPLAFQAIPALPVPGPIPVMPTRTPRPVWVIIARLGHLSDLCIAALPVCDSAAHPVAHAVLMVAAAALTAARLYGMDRLVQKIFGQNNPHTAPLPTLSACFSWWSYRFYWTAILTANFLTKVWMMVDDVMTMPNNPVAGLQQVQPTIVPRVVWIARSFLGMASDGFIAALPYFDNACCPRKHAERVTVAAALATTTQIRW